MEKYKWLDDLSNFIVEANIKTWAGEGMEVAPERKGFKELEYKKDEWRLRDSYTGYFRAPGMTTVYYNEKPSWTMAYGGKGQHEGHEGIAKPTFSFLKKALKLVTPQMPFRGPSKFSEDGWEYSFFLMKGDITDFLADEGITRDRVPVFNQIVMGGIVISKDSNRNVVYPWDL